MVIRLQLTSWSDKLHVEKNSVEKFKKYHQNFWITTCFWVSGAHVGAVRSGWRSTPRSDSKIGVALHSALLMLLIWLILGEVFNADVQCKLQFGPQSRHSAFQSGQDLCTDLHCIRDHYTWASHSALEGTHCGIGKVIEQFCGFDSKSSDFF